MTKHTPGPWHCRPYGDSFVATCGNADKRVAYCYAVFEDRSKDEAEANARLIAAAPELLEALEKAHACATLPDDGTCDGCFVSAAIAKARGNHE